MSRYSARPIRRSPLRSHLAAGSNEAGFTRRTTSETRATASSAFWKSAPTTPLRMTTTAFFPSALW